MGLIIMVGPMDLIRLEVSQILTDPRLTPILPEVPLFLSYPQSSLIVLPQTLRKFFPECLRHLAVPKMFDHVFPVNIWQNV